MQGLIDYVQGVRLELSKVTWPKKEHVVKLTAITLIISAVVGTYLGLLDYAFTKILEVVIAK